MNNYRAGMLESITITPFSTNPRFMSETVQRYDSWLPANQAEATAFVRYLVNKGVLSNIPNLDEAVMEANSSNGGTMDLGGYKVIIKADGAFSLTIIQPTGSAQ